MEMQRQAADSNGVFPWRDSECIMMESSHGETASIQQIVRESSRGKTACKQWMAMGSSHGETASR